MNHVSIKDIENLHILQVDTGRVNGEHLCIDGGSAGGYTTLAALVFKDIFKAGASFYGVISQSNYSHFSQLFIGYIYVFLWYIEKDTYMELSYHVGFG